MPVFPFAGGRPPADCSEPSWGVCAPSSRALLTPQVENLLLSSQGTVKLCDFGSATTISHFPDYSWSAQQRALVEEEVSRAARGPRCWTRPSGAIGSAAPGRLSAGSSHRARGFREGHVHTRGRALQLQHSGLLCGHPGPPASPPPCSGPVCPSGARGGSFLGAQEPSAPLVGAGCRACVCPAMADLLSWLSSGEQVATLCTCPHFPCPAAVTALLTVPTGACSLGVGVSVFATHWRPVPICHTSHLACLGLGSCSSSRY